MQYPVTAFAMVLAFAAAQAAEPSEGWRCRRFEGTLARSDPAEGTVMKIEVRKQGSVNVVEFTGAIRKGAHELLPEAMGKLLADGERHYVFDMSQVPWTDTSGMAEIVAAHKRVTEQGGRIVLALSPRVRDLFEITQLSRVFEIHEDVQQALESCGSRAVSG